MCYTAVEPSSIVASRFVIYWSRKIAKPIVFLHYIYRSSQGAKQRMHFLQKEGHAIDVSP